MTNNVTGYFDFNSLWSLRSQAVSDETKKDELLQKVGVEYESAFFKLMFDAMRKASEPLKSDLNESASMDQYEDMFYTEASHFIAQRQPLGIAQWLQQHQLAGKAPER